MRIKKFNESSDLEKCMSGEVEYTPQMNIFHGSPKSREKNYYEEIGRYIYKAYKGDLPESLIFFGDKLRSKNPLDISLRNRAYESLTIFFLTSTLSPEVMQKLWGDPVFHDEFGEGFEGEYDDETDETSEPENKSQFASYFVEIDGVKLHIGYDHRGTSFEAEVGTTPDKLSSVLKNLVDKVVELS